MSKLNDYIEINRSIYDVLAEKYQWRCDNKSQYEASTEQLGNSVLKHLAERPTQINNVLEIGPGAGNLLAFFEQNKCRTIGIELSNKMATIASKNSPNSLIIIADALAMDFIGCKFQIIYMGAVIHLFPKSDATVLLNKVWHWLDNDGLIFINTTCNDISNEGFYEKCDYTQVGVRFRRYWEEHDFIDFVLSCGFSIIEKLYTDELDRKKKWVALICKKVIA